MTLPAGDDDLEARPRRLSRGRKIAMLFALAIGLAATGAWVYARYYMPKSALGGPCKWGVQCAADAPKCMRPFEDEEGVCSHECEAGVDCAPGIRCVKVELDEIRDERGVPYSGGFCFPQAFLDAKKARSRRDAAAK